VGVWSTRDSIDTVKNIVGIDMKNVVEYVPKTEQGGKMKTNIVATVISFLVLLGTVVSYFSKQENRFTTLEEQNKSILSGLDTLNRSSEKLLTKLEKNSSDISANKIDIAINKVKIDSIQKDVMQLEQRKKK
jgi:hypothetical protein